MRGDQDRRGGEGGMESEGGQDRRGSEGGMESEGRSGQKRE